jgi:hypothetical protein
MMEQLLKMTILHHDSQHQGLEILLLVNILSSVDPPPPQINSIKVRVRISQNCQTLVCRMLIEEAPAISTPQRATNPMMMSYSWLIAFDMTQNFLSSLLLTPAICTTKKHCSSFIAIIINEAIVQYIGHHYQQHH